MNRRFIAFSLAGYFLCSFATQAAEISTAPEGYVTINIAPGTGSSRAISLISLPLIDSTASAIALDSGIITGVSGSVITVTSNANWTAGSLALAATPRALRITSGVAAGKIFQITANTTNTATVDLEGGDLNGIVANADTFEIIPLDTISTVFGSPDTSGILGGTNSAAADIIQIISNGAYVSYYYDTDGVGTNPPGWFRTSPPAPSNNVILRTDKGFIYQRLGSSTLSIILTGRVPLTTHVRSQVKNNGVTLLGSLWPIDTTLGGLALQNTPGWVSNTNSSLADQVQLYISGSWRTYFYNGTQWIRTTPQVPSNAVVIPAGSAIRIAKVGSITGNSTFASARPFNP